MVLEIIQFSSIHSSATENIRVLKYLILANVLTSPSLTTKFIICDISISLASCNVQVCHFPRWHKLWDSIHYCIFVSTSSVVFFCFIFFWLGDPADLLTKFLFLRKRVWMFKYFIRTYFFLATGLSRYWKTKIFCWFRINLTFDWPQNAVYFYNEQH